jgi:hypothetical protein
MLFTCIYLCIWKNIQCIARLKMYAIWLVTLVTWNIFSLKISRLACHRICSLLPESKQASLPSYLFDECLQKAVYELLNNSRHMKQLVVPVAVISRKQNSGSTKQLHLVHKRVSFIPLHLCAAINRRCFKYIRSAVSSAMFMNNFNVHFIWSYVNKTFIRSITSFTALQHPISEEVFVHSKVYIVFLLLSKALHCRYRVSMG